MNSLSPDNTYFEEMNLFKKHTYLNSPCGFISRPQPYVLVDGRVSVCCRDYDGSMIIGNIAEKSLSDILIDAPMRALQDAHRNKSLEKATLCKSCFVVDSRITKIFNRIIEYLIHHNPQADASFFQNKVDQFVRMFQEDTFPSQFQDTFFNDHGHKTSPGFSGKENMVHP